MININSLKIFEDNDILIINKPAGLLSISRPGKENISNDISVESLIRDKDYFLCHRIDKETSGLMIISKSLEIANIIKDMFENRGIVKKYIGLVWGVPIPASHKLIHGIRRHNIHRTKMLISARPQVQDREAITHFEVKAQLFNGAMSLVNFKIDTGRTHQIRAQMDFFGHNIVLDRLYGNRIKEHLLKRHVGNPALIEELMNLLNKIDRHMLHACSLSFAHPVTGQYIEFKVKPPECFEKIALLH